MSQWDIVSLDPGPWTDLTLTRHQVGVHEADFMGVEGADFMGEEGTDFMGEEGPLEGAEVTP